MAKSKCKHCLQRKETSQGIKTPAGFFCNVDHAFKYGNAKKDIGRKKLIAKRKADSNKKIKADNKIFREKKAALKPASKLLAEAQAAFNKYIRLRDYDQPCISCLKPREVIEAEQGWKVGGCWDAGHFMTRGAKGQLRFVLFNVHKQCKSCNAGGGRFSAKAATVDANYRVNLIKKIGVDKVEWLENNNEIDLKKRDVEYLKRVKRIFSKRARVLERKLSI